MYTNNQTAVKRRLVAALQRRLDLTQALVLQQLPYTPHAQQQAFHANGATQAERLFLAGNRCGKTLAGAYEVACHLTGDYPAWWRGRRFDHPVHAWAASVTVQVTRDILQQTYLGETRGGTPGIIVPALVQHRTLKPGVADAFDTVWIKHRSGGLSTLGFRSYDQGREKFQGTSRHVIQLDEEPPLELYDEALLRTLDVGGMILLTMTPLLGLTPLLERLLAKEAAITRAGWADATHLDLTEVKRLRDSLPSHEREAREYGRPQLGTGRVYPVSADDVRCEPFAIPDHYRIALGLDFGWRNPTAAVWGAHDPERDILYLVDEYALSEQSPAVHAQNIRQQQLGWEHAPIIADPSGLGASQQDGQSLFQLYGEHGLYLTAADNSVEAGVLKVLERLQSGRLKVFPHLQRWWQEFSTYRRDKQGRIVKRQDHLLDATRYLVTTGLGLAVAKKSPALIRPVKSSWVV